MNNSENKIAIAKGVAIAKTELLEVLLREYRYAGDNLKVESERESDLEDFRLDYRRERMVAETQKMLLIEKIVEFIG